MLTPAEIQSLEISQNVPNEWRSNFFTDHERAEVVTTLLGGLGGRPRTWKNLAEDLSQTGAVLVPALPRHRGDASFCNLGQRDLWDFADWIINQSYLHGRRANFVGASMGGMLGLAMSFMHPLTDTVVAIAPIFHMAGTIDYYSKVGRGILRSFPNLAQLPGLGATPAGNSRGMTAAGDIGAWVEDAIDWGIQTHARRIVIIEAPSGLDRCARVGRNDSAIAKLLAMQSGFGGKPISVERHEREELAYIIHGSKEATVRQRADYWHSLQGHIKSILTRG